MTFYVEAYAPRNNYLFFDKRDYSQYLYLLTKLTSDCDFDLHAYSLLPSEVHLLMEVFRSDLSDIIQKLHMNYAIYFNKRHQLDGSVFDRPYKATPLFDETDFYEANRFIHLLPLKKNVTTSLYQYRWSSSREYLSPQSPDSPIHPFLTLERTLRFFPSPSHEHLPTFLFFNEKGKTPTM